MSKKPKNLTLKEYLNNYSISGMELSKLIPCDQSHISKIANGKREPSFNMARRIEQITKGLVPKTNWYPND